MAIIKKAFMLMIETLLPFFILVNLYQVYMSQGGNNFLGIDWLGNWEDSFFGISSFFNVLRSLGNFDWANFINHLKQFFNDALPFKVVYENFQIYQNMGFTKLMAMFALVPTFLVTIFNLMIAPILTTIDGVFILLDVVQYILFSTEIIFRAIGGYYNVKYSGANNGWNTISEYIYAY